MVECSSGKGEAQRIVERVDFSIPAQPRVLRVCAYARVSTGKDAMLHSLSAQGSYYSKMIQSHAGWQYCGVYSDEAMTGTKNRRSGFQQMLEECRKGKIDLIITKSISRFARNTVTLLQTVRKLKSLGVDGFFEEQHIHALSSDGELMMTILASYAQEESLSASENQKWRVRKAFENGELMNLFCRRYSGGFKLYNIILHYLPPRFRIIQTADDRTIAFEQKRCHPGSVFRRYKTTGMKHIDNVQADAKIPLRCDLLSMHYSLSCFGIIPII